MNSSLKKKQFEIKGSEKSYLIKFKNHKRYIDRMNWEVEMTMKMLEKYKKFKKKYQKYSKK